MIQAALSQPFGRASHHHVTGEARRARRRAPAQTRHMVCLPLIPRDSAGFYTRSQCACWAPRQWGWVGRRGSLARGKHLSNRAAKHSPVFCSSTFLIAFDVQRACHKSCRGGRRAAPRHAAAAAGAPPPPQPRAAPPAGRLGAAAVAGRLDGTAHLPHADGTVGVACRQGAGGGAGQRVRPAWTVGQSGAPPPGNPPGHAGGEVPSVQPPSPPCLEIHTSNLGVGHWVMANQNF